MTAVVRPDLLTDNELLESYELALSELEWAKELLGRIEQDVYRRIEAEPGRTILPNSAYTCEIQAPATKWDDERLRPLLEILSAQEQEDCSKLVLTWNKAKLKPIVKRLGDRAQAILDGAKEPATGRGKLKFRRK